MARIAFGLSLPIGGVACARRAELSGRAVLPDVRIVHREPGDHAADPLRHVAFAVTAPDHRSAAVAARANAGFRIHRMAASGGPTAP